MRDLFKEINLVLERSNPQESTPKLIMSLKLLRRKRSFKDMVMSLIASLENVRKRSRL